jgi:hypothetical protein
MASKSAERTAANEAMIKINCFTISHHEARTDHFLS